MKAVILDIDGVLADFVWGFTNRSKRIYGLPEQPYGNGGQPDWDFREGSGLIGKQISEVWKSIKQSPTFWKDLPLLTTEADLYLLNDLHELHDLDIQYLTGRLGVEPYQQTCLWLGQMGFPFGPLKVLEGGSKAEFLGDFKDQKIAGILEDKPSEVVALKERGWPVYVRDWQYNRHVPNTIARVSSVSEFLYRTVM